MFKSGLWKSEKIKIKAVFRFQFKANQISNQGWDELIVSLFPSDSGKPTARSEKATIVDRSCSWAIPVYESVRLIQDSRTGKICEKTYQIVLSATGSVKSGVLGEISINLADYAEAFKPSSISIPLKGVNAETVLHVTVQRVLSEAEGRVLDEDGDVVLKPRGRTLRSQLSSSETEEGEALAQSANGVKSIEALSYLDSPSKPKLPSNKTMTVKFIADADLRKLHSLNAISPSDSESSSGGYTPKENASKNGISQHEFGSLLSPLSYVSTPREPISTSGNVWLISTEGSSSSSAETLLLEGSNESDNTIEKLNSDVIDLTRQLEVAKLELQTLRKQVVRESRRGLGLVKELQSMKLERDALESECAELKELKTRSSDQEHDSAEDPWSALEETQRELSHERSLNAGLHLQLKNEKQSNAELILIVRDLEELGRHKGEENSFIDPDKLITLPHLLNEEEEQCAEIKACSSSHQKNAHLITELDLYKKEREEIEAQMEQLALDYEILKQENHDISKKFEQIQLREQLRMHFDCSSHLASISELEAQIESLEKEIKRQEVTFQSDMDIIIKDKVEQEKRAIQAEEALRKVKLFNCKTAENLQVEFKRLTAQMSSAFYMNEKLVMQTTKEFNELQLQKCHLEEMLEKSNKELELVKHQHLIISQQLLSLIDFKTKEVDCLLLELKETRKELEIQRMAGETSCRDSSKQITQLTTEVESLLRKRDHLSEQITVKDSLIEDMSQRKSSVQRSNFDDELSILEKEGKMALQELNELRQLKIKNDATIKDLNAEITMLRTQYNGLKHLMFEDEKEKENIRKDQNMNLISPGLIKPSIRSKIGISTTQHVHEDASCVHERVMSSEKSRSNGDYAQNGILENRKKGKDLNISDTELIISKGVHSSEIQEERLMLVEMEELKAKNQTMGTELNDLQQRYSEMSLRFAEVEGERQHLVIKIRNLKNSQKII